MKTIMLARSAFVALLGLVFAAVALPGAAHAGVATSGAVLLDPFDPVPEIQFHHFGGYGCNYGCGYDGGCDRCGGGYRGCSDVCGGCYDGCRRHYYRRYRHDDCDDGCYRRVHDDCDDDCRRHHDGCDHDCDRRDGPPPAPPCTSEHCYNAEHYERRWRDGDHVGQEWEDRGRRERTLPGDQHAGHWYGHDAEDWHDGDDDEPPPPPPPPHDDHDDGHHHHDH